MSSERFDTAAMKAAFDVTAVLDHFSLPHSRRRAPCPLCLTSPASTAFSFDGALWYCHACGAKGDSITLYAKLTGLSIGRAIADIAAHLGLTGADPVEWDAKRAARAEAAEAAKLASEIEGIRWRARLVRRDRLRALCASMPDSPLGRDVLGNLYDALSRIEAWIETRDYPQNGWT